MTDKKLFFGRLGKNPELRYTRKQEPVCYFTLAENIHEGKTIWHKVIVWGKQAEHCSVFLKKGLPVFVRGQINRNEYEGSSGEKKINIELKAEHVGFISL